MKTSTIIAVFAFSLAVMTTHAVPVDECLNFSQALKVFSDVIMKEIKPDNFLSDKALACVVRNSFQYIQQTACIKKGPLIGFILAQQPGCQRKFAPCIEEEDALTLLRDLIANSPDKISSKQAECIRKKVIALGFPNNENECTKELDVLVAFNLGISGECPF